MILILFITVTLKQGQGHQTWYRLVDPKQGYNNAKFEKACLDSVCERANHKVLVKSGSSSVTISLKDVHKSKTVIYSWPARCA